MMLPSHLSAKAYIPSLGYNGELGVCRQCGRRTQLRDGLCLACRQEAERRNPRRQRQAGRTCADCGAPVQGTRRRYCDECAAAREKAVVKAIKARQYQRRKEER